MKRKRNGDPIDNDAVSFEISKMSLQCLKIELHRRKLSTAGLRSTLIQRLDQHLRLISAQKRELDNLSTADVYLPPSFITVPSSFTSTNHVSSDQQMSTAKSCDEQAVQSNKQLKTEHLSSESKAIRSESQPSSNIYNTNQEIDNTSNVLANDGKQNAKDIVDNGMQIENVNVGNDDKQNDNDNVDDKSTDNGNIDGGDKQNDNENNLIPAILQVRSVWVCGERNMRDLWKRAGPIGKASLSRSAPSYVVPLNEVLKGRAMRQYLELENDKESKQDKKEKEDRSNIEHLQLTLIEAYYAIYVLKLIYLKNHKSLSPKDIWKLFQNRIGPTFAPTFVAYSRYRATGWLPRSGLKYGVDWVLYPAATLAAGQRRHTHSPYCIVLNFSLSNSNPAPLDRTWVALQNRLRLVKNVAKTLVLVDTSYNPNVNMSSDIQNAFKHTQITEVTIDRWVP